MKDLSYQSQFTEEEMQASLNQYLALQPGFGANFAFYRERKPKSQVLSKYVAYFYELNTSELRNISIPIIPDGCMDITFILSDQEFHSYQIGTALTFSGLLAMKNRYVLGIRFKPGAFKLFFDEDPCQIASRQIPIQSKNLKINEINEKLKKANSLVERADILETFLITNLKFREKYELIQYCVQRMVTSKGLVNVNTLAEEVNYSARFINNLFRDYIGLSPKYMDEIIKLQSTIYLISTSNTSLCEIAFLSGFCDQSHMNRLVKKFLGGPSSTLLNHEFFTAEYHSLVNIYTF